MSNLLKRAICNATHHAGPPVKDRPAPGLLKKIAVLTAKRAFFIRSSSCCTSIIPSSDYLWANSVSGILEVIREIGLSPRAKSVMAVSLNPLAQDQKSEVASRPWQGGATLQKYDCIIVCFPPSGLEFVHSGKGNLK